MIIKKFQAETEEEAILKAKDSMGNEAVVVNIKTIKPRGIMGLFKKTTVEVTAALEEREASDKLSVSSGINASNKTYEDNSGKDIIKAIDEIRIREEKKAVSTQPVKTANVNKNPYIRKFEESVGDGEVDEKDIEKKLESLQQLIEENITKKEPVKVQEENGNRMYLKLFVICGKMIKY